MSSTSLPTTITSTTLQSSPSHSGVHNLLHQFANQVFNVRDTTYGAVGDGVANDTVAVQAAITAAVNGGIVYFPVGTYLVTTLVLNANNVLLVGVANSASIIRATTGATILLNIGSTSSVARSGAKCLLFDGNNIAGVEGIRANTPSTQTNSLYLEDVQIDNCPGRALYLLGVGNSWIRNLIGSNNGAATGAVPAVELVRAANLVTCNNNHFDGLDLEASLGPSLLVGVEANLNFFDSTVIDMGSAVVGSTGLIVHGDLNMFNGLGINRANNGDMIGFPTITGGRGRLNSFHGIVADYDAAVTSGRIINLENTAGGAGLNGFFDVAIRTLPSGTFAVRDVEVNSNFFANVHTQALQAGTLYDITNSLSVVLPTEQLLTLTYSATIATDAALAYTYRITATNTTAFTISNPTNPLRGRTISYSILNSSGGVMGAITWGTAFKLAGAFTNPANTLIRTISFYYDGTNWIELSRAAADI